MSSSDSSDEEKEKKKFFAEIAKSGRSACKKCKEKIDKDTLRLGKAAPNIYGPGVMKMWHHVDCMFEAFKKQRPTTARINTPDDIDGWSDLDEDDRDTILKHLPGVKAADYNRPQKKKPAPPAKKGGKRSKAIDDDEEEEKPEKKQTKKGSATPSSSTALSSTLNNLLAKSVPGHKDNTFREFRRLCVQVANESAYTGKTALVKKLFEKGTSGDGFKGDLRLWMKLLLPGALKRVYNLQSKQLIKLFSRILRQDQDEMLEDLEQGDVAETISKFFQDSKHCRPSKNSHLTVQEVDKYLDKLSRLTKEDDQADLFIQICEKCTSNDLTYIIRLVKHDLRINAGPKHILEAIHPEAHLAFQTSRDLDTVLEEVFSTNTKKEKDDTKGLNISVKLMTPVLPMLAEACKSIEQALKKCPNGMYSEIKYDGERVQVHKNGDEFKYFSRSLKPVMPHKVKEFKDYIPKAFPGGEDLILDSEILMIDTKTGQPLPFGTLGIHKKGEYKDACVCLFIFDCIYYNGKSLLHMPIRKRRKILQEHMTEIENRILLSEVQEVHNAKDLESMMTKVFQMGLEGLVLKNLESVYEPGKRHWLKVKKDYLFGGAMADTADLVVLGAWFGTGQKGGMMSVFLMGCWDPSRKYWCTVTKVHTGHDDKTLEQLQDELEDEMEKISKDVHRVPKWLKCTKTMVPDFVAKNPKKMPVWEITGAEFTQHDVHTAAGISIRFPRVTRIRSDKTWETATSLPELKDLFKKSKDNTDFRLPTNVLADEDNSESESSKKKVHRKMKVDDDDDDDNDDDYDDIADNDGDDDDLDTLEKESERSSSQKRKAENNSSSKLKSRKCESPKKSTSRDNSPQVKQGRDVPERGKAVDTACPKPKRKRLPSSDKDASDDENSKLSCGKQSKCSVESKASGSFESPSSEEEVEEEPNEEPQKKRKGSDLASDQPAKKVKLDDSSATPASNEQHAISNESRVKQECSPVTSNNESFLKSLIDEMKFVTNPVLYHRVKGQLFELIHKAQEEQLELDTNKCQCICIRCHSLTNKKVHHKAVSAQITEGPTKNEDSSSVGGDKCSKPIVNGYSTADTDKTINIDIIIDTVKSDKELNDHKQVEKLETSLQNECELDTVSVSHSDTPKYSNPKSSPMRNGDEHDDSKSGDALSSTLTHSPTARNTSTKSDATALPPKDSPAAKDAPTKCDASALLAANSPAAKDTSTKNNATAKVSPAAKDAPTKCDAAASNAKDSPVAKNASTKCDETATEKNSLAVKDAPTKCDAAASNAKDSPVAKNASTKCDETATEKNSLAAKDSPTKCDATASHAKDAPAAKNASTKCNAIASPAEASPAAKDASTKCNGTASEKNSLAAEDVPTKCNSSAPSKTNSPASNNVTKSCDSAQNGEISSKEKK